jgi:Spy/CpxP family protein refolding chaperone
MTIVALAVSGAGALGLGGVWAAAAHGGFRYGGHGHRDGVMVHKFVDFVVNEKLDEIKATDEQRQKVREIKDRLMKDGHALRANHGALHADLVKLLEQDQVDAAQVKALVHQRTDALVRFADEAAEAAVELHGVFTPEQRKQLLADLREHLDRHAN